MLVFVVLGLWPFNVLTSMAPASRLQIVDLQLSCRLRAFISDAPLLTPSSLFISCTSWLWCRQDGMLGKAPLAPRRYSKLLTIARQFWGLPVHVLWEMMPLAEFVTDFLRNNPDVMILLHWGSAVETFLMELWHDIDPGRFVVAGDFRCVRADYNLSALPSGET